MDRKIIKLSRLLLVVGILIIVTSSAQLTAGSNMRIVRFSVGNGDWQSIGIPGSRDFYMAFRYPCKAITNKVADEGYVDVQVLGTNNAGWFSLPHTYYNALGDQSLIFNYSAGYVELRYYGTSKMPLNSEAHKEYKLIIMTTPGKE